MRASTLSVWLLHSALFLVFSLATDLSTFVLFPAFAHSTWLETNLFVSSFASLCLRVSLATSLNIQKNNFPNSSFIECFIFLNHSNMSTIEENRIVIVLTKLSDEDKSESVASADVISPPLSVRSWLTIMIGFIFGCPLVRLVVYCYKAVTRTTTYTLIDRLFYILTLGLVLVTSFIMFNASVFHMTDIDCSNQDLSLKKIIEIENLCR